MGTSARSVVGQRTGCNSMSNVKPKDLAMVVDAPPPWGGASCTVLREASVEHHPPTLRKFGLFWWVEMARPMLMADGSMSIDCCAPDVHLRKIGGPDVDVDTVQFNPLTHEQTA